ncbi:DUF6879 family protein [Streptomyces sp. NPDC004752]
MCEWSAVSDSSDLLEVEAGSTVLPGPVPGLPEAGEVHTHSTCQRALDERLLGPRRVVVRLRVRRYFCDRKSCSRRTFNHFDGEGENMEVELTEDPEVAKLCESAFEAVWQRATPHVELELT